MSIKINLLAEAQAAEEQRRRDPVKRGIWIGGFLVLATALWILKLQLDLHFQNSTLARYEADWSRIEPRFKEVTENTTKIAFLESKLAGLDCLSTNRFLWGTLLDSLQYATVEGVQITHFTGVQKYQVIEAVPAKGKVARQPASSIERITLTIEAKDLNPAGQTYNKYKETLSKSDYFLKRLNRRDGFVLETLAAAALDRPDASAPSVAFTLESRFPERRRDE